jgi:hypothetical protein
VAQRALGPERYAERWEHGRALDVDDLVTVCATLTSAQATFGNPAPDSPAVRTVSKRRSDAARVTLPRRAAAY